MIIFGGLVDDELSVSEQPISNGNNKMRNIKEIADKQFFTLAPLWLV